MSPSALDLIQAEIRKCLACPLGVEEGYHGAFASYHVPGEGPIDAKVMIIGEAPGAEEERTGRPFIGRSGRLLTEILSAAGLDRSKMFVTSVIKCRPPKNRQPYKQEILACLPFLVRQLEAVCPKVVLTVGNVSMQALTGTRLPIGEVRGKFHDIEFKGKRYVLRPVYHPAYLLRNRRRVPGSPWDKMLGDLIEVRKYLEDNA